MTEPVSPPAAATTLPPPSVNGSAPPRRPSQAARRRRRMGTRISGVHTALMVGIVVLTVVLIFAIQNTSTVGISFLGAHLHLPLAVALLLAAVAGALVMAIAGTARITQLRQVMRRDRRKSTAG